MLRLVPPAGTPVTVADIIRAVLGRFRDSTTAEFESTVLGYSGAKRVFFVSSGQAAQYLILKVFVSLAGGEKDEVIIPAYTCYSVAASVVRAGLKVRPLDIDPTTLDYDYDQLSQTDLTKVLAINGSNLFGIQSDWSRILSLSKEHRFFTIDDAAQSFGSESKEGKSGARGDAGFYSLGRGKNMSAWSGGLLLTSDRKIASELERQPELAKVPGTMAEATILAKYFVSSLLLNPVMYRLPASLPFLHLGETVYDESFDIEGLTKFQIAAAGIGLSKLDKLNQLRAEKGSVMAKALTDSGRYQVPGFNENKRINYLRLPVLAESRNARDESIARLRRQGVVATQMYPTTIPQIKQALPNLVNSERNFPGAQTVVERLFTLPTHSYLTEADIERILKALL